MWSACSRAVFSIVSTCYVEIRQIIVVGQFEPFFLEVLECVDEQRSLIEVIGFSRKPPFINLSSDWELSIRSTTCLDAFDSVGHSEDKVNVKKQFRALTL